MRVDLNSKSHTNVTFLAHDYNGWRAIAEESTAAEAEAVVQILCAELLEQ